MINPKTYLSLLIALLFFTFSCDSSTSLGGSATNEGDDIIPTEREWQLVWSDEFDGDTLDMEKWSYQFGTGREQGLTGWGNNELQYYTDREENVRVEDGKLIIIAKEEYYEGRMHTSARIRTIDKGDWMFGRIEVCAKLPTGQGIWPAIWMLPSGDNRLWPRDGEIDIMELVGHEPAEVHGTVHFGTNDPYNHQFEGTGYKLSEGTFADDFNIFSIEWKMDEIKFFVNDNHYYTVNPATTSQHGMQYPFNNPFHLILNVAVGGNWPGSPDHTTEFPQQMVVDYIRVYQYK